MTEESPRGPRVGIKGPLTFSAFFGVVAFFGVLIFASGGTGHGLRFDLAFTAGGIAFIVCLVVAAMLSMTYKENAEHLGKGSGVNLRSADRKGHGAGHEGARADGGAGAAPGDAGGEETDDGESRA
ncbi:hypothetical protein SPF06_12170 [Sinomonas sp. JGH33]|uniref:Uncharacterized protein n=1 Tax=Sinomonas terricola TaxID=3110330 RepID=A0ABU5T7G0_9MICC|nr:hypothetical protein [Sinomonas sp. JGH33]MEA5455480.1 hypothetical protein [Sinomonas sp. JGH33]